MASRSPSLALAGCPGHARKGPIPMFPRPEGKTAALRGCGVEWGNSASVSPPFPKRRVFPKVTGDL